MQNEKTAYGLGDSRVLERRPVGPLSRVLLWCAGASPEYAALCPDDELRKHEIVGLSVVLTGAMAFLSGSLAASMVVGASEGFGDPTTASFWIGIGWGSFVFLLDRMLVASMAPGGVGVIVGLLVRVSMAGCIAYAVSRPLELWMFRVEIDLRIAKQRSAALLLVDASEADAALMVSKRRMQLEEQAASTPVAARTKQAWEECEARTKEAHTNWDRECNGDPGGTRTGIKGVGPECLRLERELAQLNRECATKLEEANKKHSEAVTSLGAPSGAAREAAVPGASSAEPAPADAGGDPFAVERQRIASSYDERSLLRRHVALAELETENPAVNELGWVLRILFGLIEIAPVLTKTAMLLGGQLAVYHMLVAQGHHRVRAWAHAETSLWELEQAMRERVLRLFGAAPALGGDYGGKFEQRVVAAWDETVQSMFTASSRLARRIRAPSAGVGAGVDEEDGAAPDHPGRATESPRAPSRPLMGLAAVLSAVVSAVAIAFGWGSYLEVLSALTGGLTPTVHGILAMLRSFVT